VRARVVVMENGSSSRVSFPYLSEDLVVYHSELTVLSSINVTITTCPIFPKKTGDHLLRSAPCANNFCWFVSRWIAILHRSMI
jgi:hypothetical protein